VSTKIGLVSDVHATPEPLKEALSVFKDHGVDMVLCAGDIAGYGNNLEPTVDLLIEHECITIFGNHEVWYLDENRDKKASKINSWFRTLPPVLDLVIENKKLHMVHANPPRSYLGGIKLLDENGELLQDQKKAWSRRLSDCGYDVLVVGHTHQVFSEQLGSTLVINPGSTKFNHTCAILNLPEMECHWFALSNKVPLKAWNWGTAFNQD
jgi:putative phosphoesterase